MPAGSMRRSWARIPRLRVPGFASSTLWAKPAIRGSSSWSSSRRRTSGLFRQQSGGVRLPAYPDGLADGVGLGQVPVDVLARDGDELVEAFDLDEVMTAVAEIGLGAEPPGDCVDRILGLLAMQVQLLGPERDRHRRAGGERPLGRPDVETAEAPGIDAGPPARGFARDSREEIHAADELRHLAAARRLIEPVGVVDLERLAPGHDGDPIGKRQCLLLVMSGQDA